MNEEDSSETSIWAERLQSGTACVKLACGMLYLWYSATWRRGSGEQPENQNPSAVMREKQVIVTLTEQFAEDRLVYHAL